MGLGLSSTSFAWPAVGGRYVWGFLAFSSGIHLLEQYLEVRQLRKNRETEVPAEISGIIEKSKFEEAQAYQKDKRLFGFVRSWTRFLWDKVGLFGLVPLLYNVAVGVCGRENENKTTLLWLLIQQWVDKPIDIPISLYSNFVIEAKHGFNKMTMQLFFSDLVKSELLTYVFSAILVPGLIWLVRYTGERFYLYVWGASQVLLLAFMWVYPNIIQPMFNKFEPLKDEELKGKIEALAAEVNFPLTKLFQIDGSKRSGHSNAYFFGFGRYKRIVLYDTLLHLKHDDILAILSHELGHWKHGHTLINLGISSAHIFALFWLYGAVMYGEVSKEIVRQFGYGDSESVMVSFMLFSMLYSPTEQLLSLLMTLLSRKFEYQADRYAADLGRGEALQRGLLQISEENKGDLNPDPWYSWYHFSHPPLVERLRAIRAITAGEKKSN